MPDSPKCRQCLTDGKLGQTYRVAGTLNFQCATCKKTFSENCFEDIEFEWRDKEDEWRKFLESRGIKVGASLV